jgi:Glycosyltransferases involved in cell wall biogenesis
MRVENPRVSIAIPAFNEAEVLPELLERVSKVLDGLPGGPHELVIVDDGSTDNTLAILQHASIGDERILVVALARNFGHQPALTAALDHITGDVAVVMDADLQDAPEVIPIMLQHYRQGYDVVYAQRASRPEGPFLRACYFLFYRTLAALAEVRLPLDSGDFALLSRRVVLHLRQMPEHHRYLRGLRTWVGFRQLGLPVGRRPRASGSSKYGLLRLVKLATDGLFAFSTIPLRVAPPSAAPRSSRAASSPCTRSTPSWCSTDLPKALPRSSWPSRSSLEYSFCFSASSASTWGGCTRR